MKNLAGLIDGLKLQAAEFLWKLPKRAAPGGDDRLRAARQTLLRQGYCVIEDFLAPATVDVLAREARQAYAMDPAVVSLESNGSDRRIYGVDRLRPDFTLGDTMRNMDAFADAFYGRDQVAWFQVLGHIVASENNLGSGSGWHRDSPFSHQFKAILYLCDVDESNGPFEYCVGSHLKPSVRRVAQALRVSQRQYRFQAEQIERLEATGVVSRRTAITGRKGTLLLIDARGLHRGRPLQSGERLALTRYYFPNGVPAEFAARYPLTARPSKPSEQRAA